MSEPSIDDIIKNLVGFVEQNKNKYTAVQIHSFIGSINALQVLYRNSIILKEKAIVDKINSLEQVILQLRNQIIDLTTSNRNLALKINPPVNNLENSVTDAQIQNTDKTEVHKNIDLSIENKN